jgi:Domain of unknown function (DUF6265)
MQEILGLSWCRLQESIGEPGTEMVWQKNLSAKLCSCVCAAGASLVLVLALGMRAQEAQGAGTSPATTAGPPPAAGSAAPSLPDGSAATTLSVAPKSTTQPLTSTAQTKPTLSDFAWLTGRWQGAWGPRIAQQVWMPPKGGVMLGAFQTIDNGDTLVIEIYTIVEKPGGISLYFRHFTPTLEPWEVSKPTVLKLASSTPKLIKFDNTVDGEPKSSIIRKIDADTYVSRSEIVPDKGDTQIVEITYHRQRDSVPAKH